MRLSDKSTAEYGVGILLTLDWDWGRLDVFSGQGSPIVTGRVRHSVFDWKRMQHEGPSPQPALVKDSDALECSIY